MVVDACEDTARALAAFSHPQVRLFRAAEDVGPYVLFNSLATHARGDVLTYHGADDIMAAGRLGAMVDLLNTDIRAGIVGTWSIDVDEALTPLRWSPRPPDGAIMVRRSVLTRLGGFSAWRFGADTEFICRALATGIHAETVPDYLLLRRVHAASLTHAPETGHQSKARRERVAQIRACTERWAREGAPAPLTPTVVPLSHLSARPAAETAGTAALRRTA